MLMNGFTKDILNTIGNDMYDAFKNNQDKLLDYEMLLPDIMDKDIENGKAIDVVNTTAHWMGMTYKEDKEALQTFILKEIELGVYPNNLWN